MVVQGRDGRGDIAYERHQPEQTLLYQLVDAHYLALLDQQAQQGKCLPGHIHRAFDSYLKCGRPEHTGSPAGGLSRRHADHRVRESEQVPEVKSASFLVRCVPMTR